MDEIFEEIREGLRETFHKADGDEVIQASVVRKLKQLTDLQEQFEFGALTNHASIIASLTEQLDEAISEIRLHISNFPVATLRRLREKLSGPRLEDDGIGAPVSDGSSPSTILVPDEGEDEVSSAEIDDDDIVSGSGDTITLPMPENVGSAGGLVLSEAHLLGLWKRSQYPVMSDGIIIFGIRGALPVDYSGTAYSDEHEIFVSSLNYKTMNCCIGQWVPTKGFSVFPGSTVPFGASVKKFVPANGVGINQMGRGRYSKYVPGWHKRKEGKNGHWALRQECAITLQRTGDDDDFDLNDRWESGKIAGDNIHCAFHMGPGANIPNSKYSSYGCQVIAGTVKKGVPGSEAGPWRKFIKPFQGSGAPTRTEYVLFDAHEVQQMIKNRYEGKSVILRMGSQGPLVETLQTQLSKKLGRTITADGGFGAITFEAVIEFQEMTFGPQSDDGIVGQDTANQLGFTLPEFDFEDAISGGSGMPVPTPPVEEVLVPEHAIPVDSVLLTKAIFKQIAKQPSKTSSRRGVYDSYLDALISTKAAMIFAKYGISKTKRRMSHFLAQASHETGSFTLKRESLNYTTVNAIRKAWRKRASKHTDAWIRDNLIRNPIGLGDWAYGGRMGNAKNSEDGFSYRGGGVFQTTGRASYKRKGDLAGVDLEGNPSLIEDPIISLIAACAEWTDIGGNALADVNALKKISRGINRGNTNSTAKANGEADRQAKFNKISGIFG